MKQTYALPPRGHVAVRGMRSRSVPSSPTAEELRATTGRLVPDLIARGLQVLFCGINPGLYSAAAKRTSLDPATDSGRRCIRPDSRSVCWHRTKAMGFLSWVMGSALS